MRKLLFTMLVLVLVIGLAITIAMPAAASTAHTDTYVSSTATMTAGYTTTDPVAGPLNPSLYSGGGSWSAAVPVSPPPSAWVNPVADPRFAGSGAVWVSTAATTEGGNGDQWRLFKADFTIPPGAYNISASVAAVTADNAFNIYFGGNIIGTSTNVYGPAPSLQPGYWGQVFGPYSFSPTVGLNTLYFIVRNFVVTVYNPTGLLYTVVVNYGLPTVTVQASAGANGTINPSGTIAVNYGANQTFTITANTSYHIADVLVDGSSVGAVTSYTFSNVAGNHTIAASFVITNQPPSTPEAPLTAGRGSLPDPSTFAMVGSGLATVLLYIGLSRLWRRLGRRS